jgi:RecB family exonuclease
MREAAREPAPVGHLSYSAVAGYERCGYRFYAERVLRLGAPATQGAGEDGDATADEPADQAPGDVIDPPADTTDADGLSRAPLSALERRLGFGNAVHAALERSALAGWTRPDADELAALLAGEGLAGDAEAQAEARELIDAWLGSQLRARLEEMRLRPEVPFVLSIAGTVVRGKIDLLATAPGRPAVVIDFKTDALRGRDPAVVGGRYAAQQDVYALAAAGGIEDGGVTAAHCFLEAPDDPVEREFDAAGLDAARSRLEHVIERMRAGAFEPTSSPDGPTCFGCPAAARLCPHPAWRPPAGG